VLYRKIDTPSLPRCACACCHRDCFAGYAYAPTPQINLILTSVSDGVCARCCCRCSICMPIAQSGYMQLHTEGSVQCCRTYTFETSRKLSVGVNIQVCMQLYTKYGPNRDPQGLGLRNRTLPTRRRQLRPTTVSRSFGMSHHVVRYR
jgi:hypothetical protein